MKTEFEWIEWIQKRVPRLPKGEIGIGDDAAVLKLSAKERLAVSTDTILDGVDFRMSKSRPEAVGRKALAINLSDLAAMGAKPKAFVIALGIPTGLGEAWIRKFYDGLLGLARQYQVVCVGGDLSRAKQFFATVTIFGEVSPARILGRTGARPGDLIAVTGKLGGSILGHQFDFDPRVKEAHFLAENFRPTAMIDISDGLVQDLGHLLKASGVGARLDLDQVPISNDALRLAKRNPEKALGRALSDGEDFELLFTISPRHQKALQNRWHRFFPRIPLSWIGEIETGSGKLRWCQKGRPVRAPRLKNYGYSHF